MKLKTKDSVAKFLDNCPNARDMSDKDFLTYYISKSCPLVCVSCCKAIPIDDLNEWIKTNDIDEIMRAKRKLAQEYPFHYGVRDSQVLEKKLAKKKENLEVLGYA